MRQLLLKTTLFWFSLSIVTAIAAHESSPATVLQLDAESWSATYCTLPLYDTTSGFCFVFPESDDCWAGYLTQRQPAHTSIAAGALVLTINVSTTDGTVFRYDTETINTCEQPARVRPIVIGKGNVRWWATGESGGIVLTPGIWTLSVPIAPQYWSNVNGQLGNGSNKLLASWQAAMSDVREIGVTFGGGCFYGHGVYVSGGQATFELLDYRFE